MFLIALNPLFPSFSMLKVNSVESLDNLAIDPCPLSVMEKLSESVLSFGRDLSETLRRSTEIPSM